MRKFFNWYRTTLIFMGLFGFLVVFQIFYLQSFQWPIEGNLSLTQQAYVRETEPSFRGTIVDRHGVALSQSVRSWDLFGDPKFLQAQGVEPESVADFLNESCGLEREPTLAKLNRKSRFVVLKKDLDPQEVASIRQNRIPGIGLVKSQKRVYPKGPQAAHLVGFVEKSSFKGLEGLERQYDFVLKSQNGKHLRKVDVRRRSLEPSVVEVEKKPGKNLKLTLDHEIQLIVDTALRDAVAKWQPRYAIAIVMEPNTGALLALSLRPTFDPAHIKPEEVVHTVNKAVAHCWEPGSILKPLVWAAALDDEVVGLEDQLYCEPQGWSLPGRVLHDHHPYGWLTVEEILVKSSNVGMAKIAQKMVTRGSEHDNSRLWSWLKRFGLGENTGIDLPGEIPGILHDQEKWGKTTWASIPMGHEIAVTPLQYLRAFCALANGGYLVKPHVRWGTRQIPEKVLSTQTAELSARILKEVVERGTGRRARIPGLEICGKTGTAQKLVAEIQGGKKKMVYSNEKYTVSFAAFAPLVNPKISVLVVLDEPHRLDVPNPYGGVVCAPVAREIIRQTLNYFELSPLALEPLQGIEP